MQPNTATPRIILVEHDPAEVFLLRRALDLYGEPFFLQVLENSGQALRFIRDEVPGGPVPSLFIVDLHLPDDCGTEVVKAIREAGALSDSPVALLTEAALPSHQERKVVAAAVSTVIVKPSDVEKYGEIAEQIHALCRTIAARRSAR